MRGSERGSDAANCNDKTSASLDLIRVEKTGSSKCSGHVRLLG
jgi:hypothetical protein